MNAKICVVGAGRWGKNHIRTLDGLGSLAGIVDTDGANLARLAEQYPRAKTFASIRPVLEAGFDGFVVATPAHTHFELASFLLENRRPVLVEKPLALTVADAVALRELSEERGTLLMVGHVLLFHPAIRRIKRLISDGKIGRLQYLYSNRLNLGTVRTEENILWSFAPHDISVFQYLVSEKPAEIVTRGGAFLQPGIHDTTMTVITYPNNVVGHVFVSWLHPFKEHRMVIIGSKGMLSYEDSREAKDILFYEKGIDWIQGEPVKREGPTEAIPYDRHMPLTEELRYFIEHLADKSVPLAGAADGVAVLEILEQATLELQATPARLAAAASPGASPAAGGGPPSAPYYVHPTAMVDEGAEVGEGTKIWHFCHVQSGARIGASCTLGQNVYVGGNVRIGDNVKIQNNVSVYEGVELEDHVFCGPSMVFTNVLDPRCKYPQRGGQHYLRTLVREGASIGANATIVCGHTIGRHAFVAAGATVTTDVPDYALMVGIPARRVGWACECGERLGDVEGAVACPRCGLRYTIESDRITADV
jgi:UDP-2-acetamido-3-amino-2,3-dideoxy-glucuronate N-acetyltransferase